MAGLNAPPDPLSLFHPLIRRWFANKLGRPTSIQSLAWPEIARGGHVLVTAPTGSGKTLAVFLWAIHQLAVGAWPPGRTRVLYVSPLKALNNDIRRNLAGPLEEIRSVFHQAGEAFPEVGLLTRSGDTPEEERRRMRRRPPEILITTPESLNILLSSRSGREMLTGLATVILDEIHAVVGTKRGTHLITAVDRLVLLSGEFQRLALSATIRPLETVAAFIGGFRRMGDRQAWRYEKRPVRIVRSRDRKDYTVQVRFPADGRDRLRPFSLWPVLAESFRDLILSHRASLLFTNSRRLAEKVTRLINEGPAGILAYAHHGSLSREIRLAVERRLKNGELRAIVATSSLELGIDIGDLDLVVLIQTPPTISAAIQRVGRSGHRVGGSSRGLLFPTHGPDLLSAAVLARAVLDQDLEPVKPIEAPLDVLAQVLLSQTALETWDVDDLFSWVKTSYPYRRLSRRAFDLVLEMLAGRYADSRLRELRPRLYLDRLDHTVHGREGVTRLLYLSGGTIPDRGYYDLRVAGAGAKIGELDEEFVWERKRGDTFTLGAQVWRIQKVTHNDVEVQPAEARPGIIPFWRAEDRDRDFHFSEKILLFLKRLQETVAPSLWKTELTQYDGLEEPASAALVAYLESQQEATGSKLPHRHHLLIEHVMDSRDPTEDRPCILHSLWGGQINRPLGLALQAAWEEKFGSRLETVQNNDGLLLRLPPGVAGREVLDLVTPENLERLLRRTLERSGFFGARFRENAGRALLLPRGDFKRRLPLWLNRLRSQRLLEKVAPFRDFPILLETWRTCLQDEFDLETLKRLLDEIRSGEIKISECATTAASPFAGGLLYSQTNTYMYADDTPRAGGTASPSRAWLDEILSSSSLRPRLPLTLVTALEEKLQRTAPGYAPRSAEDLLGWVGERLLIPVSEWRKLRSAVKRDSGNTPEDLPGAAGGKIVSLKLPGASEKVICALENLDRVARAFQVRPEDRVTVELFSPGSPSGRAARRTVSVLRKPVSEGGDPEEKALPDLLLQWLSFYGPVRKSFLEAVLGIAGGRLDGLLAGMVEDQEVVTDLLTEQAVELEICDRENLEILLRMARKARRPSFKALGIEMLPLFLAAWQGLTRPGGSAEELQSVLDQLFGFPAAADAWEKHILPARLSPYYGAWLDGLIHSGPLLWFGCGRRKMSFAFAEDLEVFLDPKNQERKTGPGLFPGKAGQAFPALPHPIGRYSFLELLRSSNLDSRVLTGRLWDLVWQGRITNDAFETLRQGIRTGFAPFPAGGEGGRPSRSAYNRWAATRPLSGNWFVLDPEPEERDPLEETEGTRDRVRQLLRRYGLLFRELLTFELPAFQWGRVFKALRLMELSGEILSGYFFEGLPGLQFVSPEAFRLLNELESDESVYWLNAVDPASLCGVHLPALKGRLPGRLPSNHLVYQGRRRTILSRRNGGALEIAVSPGDPRLPEYLAFFKVLLAREFDPEKRIRVETVNGRPARESAYAGPLQEFGFEKGYDGLELARKYG